MSGPPLGRARSPEAARRRQKPTASAPVQSRGLFSPRGGVAGSNAAGAPAKSPWTDHGPGSLACISDINACGRKLTSLRLPANRAARPKPGPDLEEFARVPQDDARRALRTSCIRGTSLASMGASRCTCPSISRRPAVRPAARCDFTALPRTATGSRPC
jgi:hypothetical protein